MVGSDRLLGVSTTFYKPDQKARIARTILDEFQCRSVPVYAGIGIYQPGIKSQMSSFSLQEITACRDGR